MHIADIKTFVVNNPPPQIGGRYFIFVKLTTNDGITGWGEAYVATAGPDVIVKMIEDVAARHLHGHDPHHIERFWRASYSSGFSQRPDITMAGCVSALEMACWDIIGKAAGKPVHQLLGGRVHEALRSYTYLYPPSGSVYPDETEEKKNVYNDPDLAAQAAALYVERDGFSAVKFDPAGPYTNYDPHQPRLVDIELSAKMVKAVREAVGTRADILFGTHGQFTPSGAARMARAIEPYDPLWFEEPCPPDMPEAMAEIAAKTSIPIATGERLTSKYEFLRVLQLKAAQILQPDLGRSGGLLETKKIAALAEAHHALVAPHCYCGPVVGAANIQLAACTPNFLVLEAIKDWGGFHAELLKKRLICENGMTLIPTEPGLGVEVDEAVAEANPWTGGPLHLEMRAEPVGGV